VTTGEEMNMNMDILETERKSHQETLDKTIEHSHGTIKLIIDTLVEAFQRGNKLLLCGNGGSAADAQHVAGEFINRFHFDHAALPAVALTTDTSVLTSIANDSTYDCIFSRQVEALGKTGDILLGITTSGGSRNVINALQNARSVGMVTIGFTGANGGEKLKGVCDHLLVVPSVDTPRIQECHLFTFHHICGQVELRLFPRVNE